MDLSARDLQFLTGLRIAPGDSPRAWSKGAREWVPISEAEARNDELLRRRLEPARAV